MAETATCGAVFLYIWLLHRPTSLLDIGHRFQAPPVDAQYLVVLVVEMSSVAKSVKSDWHDKTGKKSGAAARQESGDWKNKSHNPLPMISCSCMYVFMFMYIYLCSYLQREGERHVYKYIMCTCWLGPPVCHA